jgi:hypothetical protein
VEIDNSAMFDSEEQSILSGLTLDSNEGSEGAGEPDLQPADTSQAAEPAANVEKAQEVSQPTAEVKPASTEPAQPQGDKSAALRASRRAEKRLREQLEELQRENEALKQGKPTAVDTSITDEELAQLEADFPVQAKIVRKQREIDEQLARAAIQSEPKEPQEFEPLSYKPEVQEVIDSVPDLLAWQNDPESQDKFLRAIDYDKALSVDPDWKDRPFNERFAEAAARTKKAFGIAATPRQEPQKDPAAVVASAQVQGPKGISDFRGGTQATPPTINYRGMSDEEIMASLPVI